MTQPSSIRFVRAVQVLGAAARAEGLVVPGFRSPPRLLGVQRSIRRWPSGAMVAVVVRGRPWPAVLADLVEGVVAANRLAGPAADRARAALWRALGDEGPAVGISPPDDGADGAGAPGGAGASRALGSGRAVVARPAA